MSNTESTTSEIHTTCTKHKEYVTMQASILTSIIPKFMLKEGITDVNNAFIKFIETEYPTEIMKKVYCNYACRENINCKCGRYIKLATEKTLSDICKNSKENILRDLQELGGRPYIIKASEVNPNAEEKKTSIENVVSKLDISNGETSNILGRVLLYAIRAKRNSEIFFPERGESFELKDILGLYMYIENILTDKNKISIFVEGEDQESENIALTLYSSFTDSDYRNFGKNRFPIIDKIE